MHHSAFIYNNYKNAGSVFELKLQKGWDKWMYLTKCSARDLISTFSVIPEVAMKEQQVLVWMEFFTIPVWNLRQADLISIGTGNGDGQSLYKHSEFPERASALS